MRSALRSTGLRTATRATRALPTLATRPFSVKANAAAAPKLRPLDASKLSISKTQTPKTPSKPEDLVFGNEFTSRPAHMTIIWSLASRRSSRV